MELRVAWQLDHMRGVPASTNALEPHFRKIKHDLTQRKFAFRNRDRMNRLLMLMQLEANGKASERRYAQRVRHVLESNGGHPPARRMITDPKGRHSLWL